MKLQELQIALDRAYKEMRQRAYDPWDYRNQHRPWGKDGGIVTSRKRWANAVTEPDCSYNWSKYRVFDPEEGGYMWEPKGRIKSYFTTLPCKSAVHYARVSTQTVETYC